MDGRKASVRVASEAADVLSSTQNSVTFSIPEVPEGEREIVISSEGKTAMGKITILPKTALTPSFTLNPTQAAPGDEVTATLTNYSGVGAAVSVAGKAASVKSATSSKVIFFVPDVSEGNKEVIIKSEGKEAKNTLNIVIPEVVLTLDRNLAERGETVNADVSGANLEGAILKVANISTSFTIVDQDSFSFVIPSDASAGSQRIILETSRGNAEYNLDILGDVEKGKLTIILKPETSEEDFETQLSELNTAKGWGIFVEDKNVPDSSTKLRTLGMSTGPCSGKLADIDVGDVPLSEAIKELEKLEQNGEGISFYIDPRSKWSTGVIDHLNSITAPAAHARGHTGSGVLIAVLDTGVGNGTDPITELGPRLRSDLAYDFVNQDEIAEDDFDQAGDLTIEGHGTPIAVLAAGRVSGVAPDAEILPIKTCDGTGKCLSSDVILGMCHSLKEAQAEDMSLVINLSLGGDTPVDALEAVLDYALSNNVLVAAAAGNEGEFGSPVHYPAAYDLPGLVAVGALEAPDLSCVDFEEQKLSTPYDIDLANENGVDVTIKPFILPNGDIWRTGEAQIGGSEINKVLLPSNTNVDIEFNFPLDGITLNYLDQGGNINLELNNITPIENAEDFTNKTIGPVDVSVSPGVLNLRGPITQFAIGGQELIVDNICPLKTLAWQPATFSTRGDYVDISAPGKNVRSSSPANAYGDYEGTSFSTPLVAGALALYREAKLAETAAAIEAELKASAIDLPFAADEVGEGILNLSLNP
jgi:subtilisin